MHGNIVSIGAYVEIFHFKEDSGLGMQKVNALKYRTLATYCELLVVYGHDCMH